LADGFININTGAVVNVASHLWWGVSGTAEINISGTLNQTGGILGLGTSNASTPGGGTATVNLLGGGLLALNNISSNTNLPSIQPGSFIDIQGGTLTLPGNFGQVITNYVDAGKIIAYGGPGTVNVVIDEGVETNTIVTATAPPVVTAAVWTPASNTNNSDGLWTDGDNWDSGVVPTAATDAILNVAGSIPCTLPSLGSADAIISDVAGLGGTLIVTNGGALTVAGTSDSVIASNATGTVVVDGGSMDFGGNLYVGLNSGASGVFTMNSGSVTVDGTLGLGWNGGTGTLNVNGGLLTLAGTSLTYPNSIQGASVLNLTGSGVVLILGDWEFQVLDWIDSGNITANGTSNVFVSYSFDDNTTTLSASYIPPELTIWNPAANPSSVGSWHNTTNWTQGLPGSGTKTVFNVPGAITCWVTELAVTDRMVQGDNGPGGTIIVTNGGNLIMESTAEWSAINYNDTNTATMIVEDGGSVSFGHHCWIGQQTNAVGVLIMNGGTVSVGQQFGLGWDNQGGTGTALIKGGTLNLFQIHPTLSITGDSVLDVSGTGEVIIQGDRMSSIDYYVSNGFITSGGTSNVIYYLNDDNETVITTVAPPAPITILVVSGGNATITYDTFPGVTYSVESTLSLTPPIVWTPVAGTTTNAVGSSVTQTFPVSGSADTYYRTVSP
jgi:hypothetical protein